MPQHPSASLVAPTRPPGYRESPISMMRTTNKSMVPAIRAASLTPMYTVTGRLKHTHPDVPDMQLAHEHGEGKT